MHEENGPQQEAENSDQQQAKAPTPVEPVHAEPDQQATNAAIEQEERDMSRFERVTIFLAVVGTLLALGTAVIFHNQFQEMAIQTSLLGIAAKQARRDSMAADLKAQQQLKLAADQTKAAQDSVKAIQRQMRQDQRAWIRVTYSKIKYAQNDATKVVGITDPITITNTGKTPARHVLTVAIIEVVPIKQGPSLKYNVPMITSTEGYMAPTDQATAEAQFLAYSPTSPTGTVPRYLSPEEFDDLRVGKTYTLTYGKVYYFDVFGTLHWVHFCTFGSFADVIVSARGCTNYNDIDKR